MNTTNNITNKDIINIYYNTYQTINPNKELFNKNHQNVDIPTKVCNTCRTIKYETEFYKERRTRKDGYQLQCIICDKTRK